MRRASLVCALLLTLSLSGPPLAAAANGTENVLQGLVNRAAAGETVVIPSGRYEGTLVVDKPLVLRAEGDVLLVNRSGDAAITVTADHVRIERLSLLNLSRAPAVKVEANHSVFTGLRIRTASCGIQLQGASGNEIRNSDIARESEEGTSGGIPDRGNGIDLYDSHNNRIAGNFVLNLFDAIYLENSDNNVVENNRVEQSRYGIHLMYTDGTIVRNNTGALNITGAMIMAVRDVETSGNRFYKQFENVHSQGILLFDAHDSRFADNVVEGNRVGFYVEQSSDNTFTNNRIRQNFIGVQFIEASGNRFAGNSFVGNVTDAEARASADNRMDGNFWDSFAGIDHDGDGRSDIANAVNPFFLLVTSRTPAFQLFFQSPGMVFLADLLGGDRRQWMTDHAPLLAPPAASPAKGEAADPPRTDTAVPGVLLLVASLSTILLLGVRRS